MNDLIRFGFLPAAALALPLAAHAGAPTGDRGISYNYLEGAWVFGDELDVEGAPGEDVNGSRFGASAALTPNVFVYGQSTFLNIEDFLGGSDDDVDLDTQSLGVGYTLPLMPGPAPLDVWGSLSYERLNGAGDTADGYGATLGTRWMPMQGLELNAFGGLRDYGDAEGFGDIFPTGGDLDGWAYGIGAVYNVTQQLALTADWQRHNLEADPSGGGSKFDVDLDTFSVGARWYY